MIKYIVQLICYLQLFFSITSGEATCDQLAATQDTQYIYSHPGYLSGEPYPSNTDKCWLINADPNTFTLRARIYLNIEYLQLEDSTNCSLDYLDVYYGNSSEASRKARLCILGSEAEVWSIDPNLYLHFVTDSAKQGIGFKISYKAVLAQDNSSHGQYRPVKVSGCSYLEATSIDQYFYSHDGYVDNTNYPDDYDACWIIHIHPSLNETANMYYGLRQVVQLAVDSLYGDYYIDVEYDSNCALDYVTVFDGNTTDGNAIGRYCGRDTFNEHSFGSYLYVRFQSDKSQNFNGFKLKYNVVFSDFNNATLNIDTECTYLEATHSKQTFVSHADFGHSKYTVGACWIIIVATDRPNDVVQLTEKDFSLYANYHYVYGCREYVEFYDGPDKWGSWTSRGEYCDSFYNLASRGRYMYINFYVAYTNRDKGFKILYYAVDRADAINGKIFPKWAIALIVLGVILGILVVIGFFLLVFHEQVKKCWDSRGPNCCRRSSCSCFVKIRNRLQKLCEKETAIEDEEIEIAVNSDPIAAAAIAGTSTETVSDVFNTTKKEQCGADAGKDDQPEENSNKQRRRRKPRKKTVPEKYEVEDSSLSGDDEGSSLRPFPSAPVINPQPSVAPPPYEPPPAYVTDDER